MSFSAYELSIFGGRPVELYRFTVGSTVYTYCAKGPVTYNSETYAKASIKRDRICQDEDMAKDALRVTVDLYSEISQLFIPGSPNQVVGLTIYKYHQGDTEVLCIWKGRVVLPTWNENQCVLTCESIYSRKKLRGRCPRHTKLCRVDLYGDQCLVVMATYAVSVTIGAIGSSGMILTVSDVSGYDSGYFTNGLAEVETGIYKTITTHSGSNITLWSPHLPLEVNDEITIYPGCDRSIATCASKFSNHLNYKGSPHLADDNPFIGALI